MISIVLCPHKFSMFKSASLKTVTLEATEFLLGEWTALC